MMSAVIIVTMVALCYCLQLFIMQYYFFLNVYTVVTIEFSEPRYATMESTGVLQAALIASLPLNSNYQVRVRFSSGSASSKHINSHEYLIIILYISRK